MPAHIELSGLTQTITSHTQKLPSSSDCICCLNSIRLGCLDSLKTGFKLCCVRGITSRNCLNYYLWRTLQTARTSSIRFNWFFFSKPKHSQRFSKWRTKALKISWRNSELLEWKLTQELGMKSSVGMEWRSTILLAWNEDWPWNFVLQWSQNWPRNFDHEIVRPRKCVLTIKKNCSTWPWKWVLDYEIQQYLSMKIC